MRLVSKKASCEDVGDMTLSFSSRVVIFLFITVSSFTLSSTKQPRVITSSPAMTELVFQLGHGNNLVAVSNFSNYPDEARDLPRIGMLFSPNIEAILRFSPDLILIDGNTTPDSISAPLKKMGITLKEITITTVEDLFSRAADIAFEIFKDTDSPTLLEMKHFYAQKIQNHPKKSFSYLITAWNSPITLVGHSTFLSDLLKQYGGQNISPSQLKAPYPQVSFEWLIKHPPDVLFSLTRNQDEIENLKSEARKWWPNHPVKVVSLSADDFARTSFTPLKILPAIMEQIP